MANADEPKVVGDTSEAPFEFDTAKGAEVTTPPIAGEGDRAQPQRGAAKRFKMTPPSRDLQDSYADGALGIMMRDAVFKIELYRVIGIDQESGEELRAVSHRLVLPITAIGELAGLLQGTLQRLQKDGRVTIRRTDAGETPDKGQ